MTHDFLIIGGGIAGVSAGARLSELGTVLLLEAEPALAYHASGRSAALYEAQYGKPATIALNLASRAGSNEGNLDGGACSARGGLMMLAAPGEEEVVRRRYSRRWACPRISVEGGAVDDGPRSAEPRGDSPGWRRMAMPGTSTPTGWCSISRATIRAKGGTVKGPARRSTREKEKYLVAGPRTGWGRVTERAARRIAAPRFGTGEPRRGALGRTGSPPMAGHCAHRDPPPLWSPGEGEGPRRRERRGTGLVSYFRGWGFFFFNINIDFLLGFFVFFFFFLEVIFFLSGSRGIPAAGGHGRVRGWPMPAGGR